MARPTVALCGAGMMSGVHGLAAELLGLPIVAVASRTHESADARARQVKARVVGYHEIPAGADVTIVATPPARHATDAARVLLAGGAVVVEKPLCTTLADADVLVEAVRAGGRLLYAENLAYAPAVEAMLARVHSLGVLTSLEARAFAQRPAWGGATHPEWGGGVLFDVGAHPIALALLLAGPARVVTVRATLERPGDERPGDPRTGDPRTDDHAEVRLTFDTGLTATVVASWRSPTPVWDVQVASAQGVLRAELLPEPTLEHNGDPVALPPLSHLAKDAPQLDEFGYLGQLRSFVEDLSRGRPPRSGAELGRAVLEVVCGAYTSARVGDDVDLPFAGPRDRTPWELWQPH